MTDPARPKSADAEALLELVNDPFEMYLAYSEQTTEEDSSEADAICFTFRKFAEFQRLCAATQPSPHSGEWNAAIEAAVVAVKQLRDRQWSFSDGTPTTFGEAADECVNNIRALTRPIQQSGGEER